MRRAHELAAQCNAHAAIVLFDDKGRLTQFSTGDMDALLEQYGAAVAEPHERYTPQDVRFCVVFLLFGGGGEDCVCAGARASCREPLRVFC
jgi:hypothetical protein